MIVRLVGVGAVGAAVAAFASCRGFGTELIGRTGVLSRPVRVRRGQNEVSLLSLPLGNQPDIVFIATKAQNVTAAAEIGLQGVADGTSVVVVSNGAIDEILTDLSRKYSRLVFRQGLVTFGVSQSAPGCYLVASPGELRIGMLGEAPPIQPAEQALLGVAFGVEIQWIEDLVDAFRTKWLLNVAINSVSGARKLPTNGELAIHAQEVDQTFDEGLRLAMRIWPDWRPNASHLRQTCWDLIAATKNNENSMARDVRLRKDTEVAFLSGRAEEYGDEFPKLVELSQRIREG